MNDFIQKTVAKLLIDTGNKIKSGNCEITEE